MMAIEETLSLIMTLFSDYTIRNVSIGAAVLGITSGALGCFTLLRRQSLLGDALSHAALPGIAVAFLIVGYKEPLFLMLGAALFAWFGGMIVFGITNTTRIKQDAALGIVLSVFFGFGIVLLTHMQGSGMASQAGLDRYLFGQAVSLTESDIASLGILASGSLAILIMFFKEFKLAVFDKDFAQSIGFSAKRINMLLTSIVVVAIVVGIHTVGVVLMVSMLIAPAASARQWTSRLSRMVLLSSIFGALSGVAGAIVSSTAVGISTGPVIVLTITMILMISLLFSPERGYLVKYVQRRSMRRTGGA